MRTVQATARWPIASFAGAVAIWSMFALALVVLVPGMGLSVPCMRLVGRSAACEATQATVNRVHEVLLVWPMAACIVAGYLAIVLVALRRPSDAASPSDGESGGHVSIESGAGHRDRSYGPADQGLGEARS